MTPRKFWKRKRSFFIMWLLIIDNNNNNNNECVRHERINSISKFHGKIFIILLSKKLSIGYLYASTYNYMVSLAAKC